MLDALPIMRDGRFLEAETRAALAAGRWPARAPDRNIADLKAQIAACQAGAAAVSEMIRDLRRGRRRPLHDLRAGRTPPPAVRRALGRLSDGGARVPDGRRRRDRRAHHRRRRRPARRRSTSPPRADQLATNFNAPLGHRRRRGALCLPHPGGRRHPAERRLPGAAEHPDPPGLDAGPRPPAAVVAGNVETSQHVVDALYAALGVMANTQGSMNNFTFGDERRIEGVDHVLAGLDVAGDHGGGRARGRASSPGGSGCSAAPGSRRSAGCRRPPGCGRHRARRRRRWPRGALKFVGSWSALRR